MTANRKRLFAVALAACSFVAVVSLFAAGPVSLMRGGWVLLAVLIAAAVLAWTGAAEAGAASNVPVTAPGTSAASGNQSDGRNGAAPGAKLDTASVSAPSGDGYRAGQAEGPDGLPESAMMARMASLLAHDLCNALSAVKVNLQILARQLPAVPEQHPERCRVALAQVSHIEKVIGDLQTFARPGQIELADLDLREVVNAAVLGSLARLEGKNIDTARRDGAGLPLIRGDRVRLVQVVEQLIDNAVEASEPGHRIMLQLRRIDPPEGGLGIQLSVIDQGSGMAEDVLTRAREPFFTTKSRGSGLGLAIAERVVKHHGGTLSIDSQAGVGTTVALHLPAIVAD